MRRRGALTLIDIIMLFISIVVLVQLYPTIVSYAQQAASQSSGLAAIFWNMIPWMLPLAVIATIWKKTSSPTVEYEEE